jgi:mediator of RNA polymerase II transcription subunit 21
VLLRVENKKELVVDLVRKAKQIEFLINSLPVVEPEETQAARFVQLEEEMQVANAEYKAALERARMPSSSPSPASHLLMSFSGTLHKEITTTLRILTDMQDIAPS